LESESVNPEPAPYPGLSAFTKNDRSFFFGREGEVEALWRKIEAKRLVALVGPSGAGKSSFLMAGLLPARPEDFRAVFMTPGNSPVTALARALVPELSDDPRSIQELVSAEAVIEAVASWRALSRRGLLIVDAFEELFTLNPPDVRKEFASLIGRIASQSDVHVLLSMRDDFFARCHEHQALAPIFQDVTPLLPLQGPALRRALVEPARLCGYGFEDDALIDEILGEAEEERGAMPILAFAAAQLWGRRDRERKLLTRAAFEEIGRGERALARHADATLDTIGISNAPVVRESFRNLVSPEGTRASRESEVLPSSGTRAVPWPFALVLALLSASLAVWALWRPAPEAAPPLRLSAELGAAASLATGFGPAAILSPDGRVLAFVASQGADERRPLYVRRLEQLDAAPLAGTEGARSPFFSPDGKWIAFFAGGKLKKVSVSGGAPVTLCDAEEPRGGTWAEDGTIFFAPSIQAGVDLLRVSSAGGTPQTLTAPDQASQETTLRWPQALRGGKAVLYTASRELENFEDASLVVHTLAGDTRKVLYRGGYHGRYLPSGHLVFIHEGTLFAAEFALDRLELTGEPVPVLAGVSADPGRGGAQFAFSSDGTLVYQRGEGLRTALPVQWMDREGKLQPLRMAPGLYSNIRFSPDGRWLALDVLEGKNQDVWVYDWARDIPSRLTFDLGVDAEPVWTPDGQRIAFSSSRADSATPNLYWQRAYGTGEAERLTESANPQIPTSWHPSGEFLAFEEYTRQTRSDILILPLTGDEASGWKPGKPTVFLNSPFEEYEAAFSPDGRWLAYSSNESGRYEVYVRPYPGPGGKWQVSIASGSYSTWSRSRRELLFRAEDGRIMVAAYIVEGDSFRAEKPRVWSPGLVPWLIGNQAFDLHPGGERVAVVKASGDEAHPTRDKVVLIQNFFDELRRLAPGNER
jgi:serine/threonine-protein kinase